MGPHQRDIASFFGGRPKTNPATLPSMFASKSKSTVAAAGATIKPEDVVAPKIEETGDEALTTANEVKSEAPETAAPAQPKLKRLRKGRKKTNEEDAAASVSAERRASLARPTVASPAASGLSDASSSGSDLPEGYEDEDDAIETTSSHSTIKKPTSAPLQRASAQTKVEGVGLGAIKAAAEHADVDVSKLVTWPAGAPVPFGFLADTFEAIAEESKRLQITRILVGAMRAVLASAPADLLPLVYLCCNRVAPAHEGLELGIGDATLVKALAQVTGKKESAIRAEYGRCGDLGAVAAAARGTQRTMFPPPRLTVRGVFQAFRDIAAAEGAGSQERKKGLIVKLLVAARDNEAGYVMRALQGKLRIGLAEQTVLVSLAHAVELSRQKDAAAAADDDNTTTAPLTTESLANRLEEAAQRVKTAYSRCPSYDELVPALLAHGCSEITTYVRFTPGVPVKPMLAKPTNGVSEVLDKFSDQAFTCEFKYDGERAQVHVLEGGAVRIYSRNSEDNTGKYPDVAALLPRQLAPGVASVVLDAEVVAVDRGSGRILPFQILSTRARKDVTLDSIKVAVCLYVFDCLFLNGEELAARPLTARREAMRAAVREAPGELLFAEAKTSTDVEELSRFLDEAVEAGTEGLIVKTLKDTYEPSRRSSHWLKLKKDYLEGVGDTFDVVPIGAWFGRGKRTGVYGSYLLAIYDPENEQYQTICKIGTGFSEELLKDLADSLRESVIPGPRKYYRWGETLTPDIWFEPKAVWEIKAADLSVSPVHKAAEGLVDASKGISIRFPRLVRVRDDKGPEDTTGPEQVADMYRSQAVLQQANKTSAGDGDEY